MISIPTARRSAAHHIFNGYCHLRTSSGFTEAGKITNPPHAVDIFVEELLNSEFEPIREGMFMYNYRGIDYLEVKPDAAYKNIITFIQNISDFKRSTPSSLVVKAFFDAKYQELAETFRNYQDKSILQLLSTVDPTHESTYMGRK